MLKNIITYLDIYKQLNNPSDLKIKKKKFKSNFKTSRKVLRNITIFFVTLIPTFKLHQLTFPHQEKPL